MSYSQVHILPQDHEAILDLGQKLHTYWKHTWFKYCQMKLKCCQNCLDNFVLMTLLISNFNSHFTINNHFTTDQNFDFSLKIASRYWSQLILSVTDRHVFLRKTKMNTCPNSQEHRVCGHSKFTMYNLVLGELLNFKERCVFPCSSLR